MQLLTHLSVFALSSCALAFLDDWDEIQRSLDQQPGTSAAHRGADVRPSPLGAVSKFAGDYETDESARRRIDGEASVRGNEKNKVTLEDLMARPASMRSVDQLERTSLGRNGGNEPVYLSKKPTLADLRAAVVRPYLGQLSRDHQLAANVEEIHLMDKDHSGVSWEKFFSELDDFLARVPQRPPPETLMYMFSRSLTDRSMIPPGGKVHDHRARLMAAAWQILKTTHPHIALESWSHYRSVVQLIPDLKKFHMAKLEHDVWSHKPITPPTPSPTPSGTTTKALGWLKSWGSRSMAKPTLSSKFSPKQYLKKNV